MAVLFLTALVPAAVMAATLGLERLEHHLLRPAPASDSDATTVRAVLLLLLRLWESPPSSIRYGQHRACQELLNLGGAGENEIRSDGPAGHLRTSGAVHDDAQTRARAAPEPRPRW
jgi:hypothetical protein